MEHELDFIKGQQSELEELLRPLEASVGAVDLTPHAVDVERERTYQLAETLDAQLQRMSDDLREVIEHLNSANAEENRDEPVAQIGKVLNAHMDSLHWIDVTSEQVQKKIEEVGRMQDLARKETDRAAMF